MSIWNQLPVDLRQRYTWFEHFLASQHHTPEAARWTDERGREKESKKVEVDAYKWRKFADHVTWILGNCESSIRRCFLFEAFLARIILIRKNKIKTEVVDLGKKSDFFLLQNKTQIWLQTVLRMFFLLFFLAGTWNLIFEALKASTRFLNRLLLFRQLWAFHAF